MTCRIFPAETLFLCETRNSDMEKFVRQHQRSIDHFETTQIAGNIFKAYVVFNNAKTLDAFGQKFNCAGFSQGSKRLEKE